MGLFIERFSVSSTPVATAPRGKKITTAKTAYRPEIQGLRALAVLLVVVYHVWLGRVSGGVDIFLLISAFLMTASFVRKVESERPLELLKYWANVLRRLLPAASVVLVAVLIGSYFILPSVRWPEIFSQTWASLFYRQNWELANQAIDYQAASFDTASPLQHFWSLSIQGQVFLLWPLLFAVGALATKILRIKYRTVMVVAFGTVFTSSFIYSVVTTAENQPYAYFDTRARLWEFAFGSLLALLLPYLTLPRVLRVVAGWTGFVIMFGTGLVLTVENQFPGYVALLPLIAAALILAAGQTESRWGADRVLSAKPLVGLGGSSYALYLWHWPLLIFWMALTETESVSLVAGGVIIAVSLVLAQVTTRVLETPLRTWKWPSHKVRRTLLVAGALVLLVAAPLTGWQTQVMAQETKAQTQTVEDNPGAATLRPDFQYQGDPGAVVKPLASSVNGEWAAGDRECQGAFAPGLDPRIPDCLQVGDPATADKNILVIGNSHMQQWYGAFVPLAQKNNWSVAGLIKFGCRYGGYADEFGQECNDFIDGAREAALTIKPELIVVLGTLTEPGGTGEVLIPELATSLKPFTDSGIDVLALRDNPRFTFNMAECISKWGATAERCQADAADLYAPKDPLDALAKEAPEVATADLAELFCPGGVCRGAIGNVMVYMDENHVTKTYMESLAPQLEQAVLGATDWKVTPQG